jgi:hypothetical protein
MDLGATSREPGVSSKKNYVKPELHIYGNIEEITLQGGHTGVGDNNTKKNGKTGG